MCNIVDLRKCLSKNEGKYIPFKYDKTSNFIKVVDSFMIPRDEEIGEVQSLKQKEMFL